MVSKVFNFSLELDWSLIAIISQIDRFDASWTAIERSEDQNLKQLKSIATVRSVGASTRIEGSKMTDEEVESLLKAIDVSKLADRDSQEVVGYFETLDIISEAYGDIDVTASQIKNLHNMLMKYSVKDEWHKGEYKKHSNAVEANYPDGTRQIIFHTTEAGMATEIVMHELIEWYNSDQHTHTIVKCAVFVYEFLSIHPFQDGNGRLSRLLATLLLLKSGYKWIQYVSFEYEIENRKLSYYKVLRGCQAQRPGENITDWNTFFFDCLKSIQGQLLKKLKIRDINEQLLPREKIVLNYIEGHPGCKSGDVSKRTGMSRQIIIRTLSGLMQRGLVLKHGSGSGTQYSAG